MWTDWFHLDFVMNNTMMPFLHRYPQYILLLQTKDVNVKNKLMSVTSASLIPFIVTVNLLLIFGIIKTKRNNFTSSQILFLTLFVSDLTFGVVQISMQTYTLWKSHAPTCSEIQASIFFMTFPLCMSGTLLCVISLDRYICVLHNNNYKRIVTKLSLTITIVWVILTSITWATLNVLFKTRLEIAKIAKLHFALSAYTGAMLLISVALYAALLTKVKQTTKNSPLSQGIDSSLTKTIAVIIATQVVNYFPLMVCLNIFGYGLLNSTDKSYLQKLGNDLLWTMIPCHINAIINSAIYFARNGQLKRYYSKLFNCGNDTRNVKEVAHPNASLDGKTKQHLDFMPGAKNLGWYSSQDLLL